ncbi:hypothetical protein [Streptomyces sp. NPDC085596]|uniref:hypothetical protein n=1 Tax=Streptomyces sp. NPDC085596 TaxID=3365731 RepID=UPI0037D6D002
MISKSGRYWSTGITVTYSQLAERINDEPYGGWHAALEYTDDGFANNDPDTGQVSTEGTLHTRYPVRNAKIRSGLSVAVDTLLADAKRLGIEFIGTSAYPEPWLYYNGDGESAEHPPPTGWRETLAAEAERIGFRSYATPVK